MLKENQESNVFNEEGDKVYCNPVRWKGKSKKRQRKKIIREKKHKLTLYNAWVQYIKDELEYLKTW